MRRTKIVATIGPATDTPEQVREMIAAGVNVVRLNFSHGTHDDHARYIGIVRHEAREMGRSVALLQDLQGPKIRTGPLKDNVPVQLVDGQQLIITTEPTPGDAHRVSTNYPHLPQDVSPGDRILISDGLIDTRVVETTTTDVACIVIHGNELRPRQGLSLPGVHISWPSIMPKDLDDLAFGLAQGVDYVAISFVRQAADVLRIKEAIREAGADVPVIAKLEKAEAVEALDAIVQVADGIMVARGDMGVEISPERVPVLQKDIIEAANRAGVPVITATQMLESMIGAPQATRAEVSDVANAILDGSDAVMLSGETAIGAFPIRAIRMMDRIADAVEERAIAQQQERQQYLFDEFSSVPQGIAAAVSALSRTLPLAAVCVVTSSGSTARLVSTYRPGLPIFAFTPLESTYQRLSLLWGVTPIKTEFAHTETEYYDMVESVLLRQGYAQPGDNVVITGGHPITQRGPTNFAKVLTLGTQSGS
jgi:pyruvate kinase